MAAVVDNEEGVLILVVVYKIKSFPENLSVWRFRWYLPYFGFEAVISEDFLQIFHFSCDVEVIFFPS